jgi:hypothetical protein
MSFTPPPFAPPPEGDPRRSLRDALEREAADVEARLGRLDHLAAQAAEVDTELRAIFERHAEARAAATAWLGPVVRTRRCGRGFWALPGDLRVRECDCGLRVVDPARMSASEVRAALGVARARPITLRDDGTVSARPCDPVAARRALLAMLGACGGVAVLLVGVALAVRAVPHRAHLDGSLATELAFDHADRPYVDYALDPPAPRPQSGNVCRGPGVCAWQGHACFLPPPIRER